MVTEIFKQIFICPYCNKKYYNLDDCDECIEEHVDKEYAITDEKFIYKCDFCDTEHDNEYDAEECESEHIENNDSYYTKYKLKQAGKHPNQSVLF
jgi:hypothetical protein